MNEFYLHLNSGELDWLTLTTVEKHMNQNTFQNYMQLT
jgi:hypothetical protein